MADILLPKKDETVLLYDIRNNNHNGIFTNGTPKTLPTLVYDIDTNNIYKFNVKQQALLNNYSYDSTLTNTFYNHLLSMNTVQEWKSKENVFKSLIDTPLKNLMMGKSYVQSFETTNKNQRNEPDIPIIDRTKYRSDVFMNDIRNIGSGIKNIGGSMINFCNVVVNAKNDLINQTNPINMPNRPVIENTKYRSDVFANDLKNIGNGIVNAMNSKTAEKIIAYSSPQNSCEYRCKNDKEKDKKGCFNFCESTFGNDGHTISALCFC
jgi:hypothetical protein